MEPLPTHLVRLCITTEDKEVQDVVVHEEDTIWAVKIRLFELLGIFPAKQSVSFKDPEEVCSFSFFDNLKNLSFCLFGVWFHILENSCHSCHETLRLCRLASFHHIYLTRDILPPSNFIFIPHLIQPPFLSFHFISFHFTSQAFFPPTF